ncbi:MAG: acetate/propionate family kinase [Mucilaginibacter sp.]
MNDTTAYILALNCGSSSLKFTLFGLETLKKHLTGIIRRIGQSESNFDIEVPGEGLVYSSNTSIDSIASAVQITTDWFKSNAQYHIIAIGHRIVQGGPCHRQPEIIDDFLLQTIKQFVYLAPNHLPDEIAAIRYCKTAFPDITQVACFDTGFHKDLPDYAAYYPLPVNYREEGLIRYGYHGLSYEYVLNRLITKDPDVKNKKIVIAHLGNGVSITAVKDGQSIETTMGISPMGGLMMGTRPGDLDPGVPLFLLKKMRMPAAKVESLLNKRSGLKGIAGISDMEELLEKEELEPRAKEALTMFCYQARKAIGSLAAALNGLDMLVFTGGIGENAPVIRKRICKELKFLGIRLSKKSNSNSSKTISSAKSKVKVLIVKTDEEAMLARHTRDLLQIKTLQKH